MATDLTDPFDHIVDAPFDSALSDRYLVYAITIRQGAVERRIDNMVKRVSQISGHRHRLAAKIHGCERGRKSKRPDHLRMVRPKEANWCDPFGEKYAEAPAFS